MEPHGHRIGSPRSSGASDVALVAEMAAGRYRSLKDTPMLLERPREHDGVAKCYGVIAPVVLNFRT